MRTISSDRLGLVLFGKGKRAILSQLLGHPDRKFFVRELARASHLSPSSLTRDLSSLTETGVILRTEDGRQVYYQANTGSPVYPELRGLVAKTFGIADVLRNMLNPFAPRIRIAAIYGSVAPGTHVSRSDVDLLIVGDVSTADLAKNLIEAERTLGRSISPTIYPASEFAAAAKNKPFVKAILSKPMVLVMGDENELKRFRQGSAAKPR
jgi:DNA-binding transcriptional ArsR family regulator